MQVWRRASQCLVVKGQKIGFSSRMELAYLGGMVVVEFEGYGALRAVSKGC